MAQGWHVTSQTQEERLQEGTFTFTPGMKVMFQLDPEGTVGAMWFSHREYRPEIVEGRIQSQVDLMRAIGSL